MNLKLKPNFKLNLKKLNPYAIIEMDSDSDSDDIHSSDDNEE